MQRAASILAAGGVVGLPTETVYGLAADGTNPLAVREIFELKGRPHAHPVILHLGRRDWLSTYALDPPQEALDLAERFWPGPLTLVVRRNPKRVPDEVTGGQPTVALRMPDHPLALAVITALGRPVAAPSANRFGRVSPTCVEHVRQDLGNKLPLILDGGACQVGVESTILDLSRAQPYLLRPGKATRQQIAEVLGRDVLDADGRSGPAPGTLASHYAPRATVEIAADPAAVGKRIDALSSQGERVGLIGFEGQAPARGVHAQVTLGASPEDWARRVYAALRELDQQGCSWIVSVAPVGQDLAEAVRDRLTRAAAPRSAAD